MSLPESLPLRWFRLEAQDALLFRDSRPFSAGSDFRAEGVFPPLPTPIAGALRTALLAPLLRERGKTFADLAGDCALSDIRERFGTASDLGQLAFLGPFVCRFRPGSADAEPLFTAPADLLGDRAPRLSADFGLPGLRRKATPGIEGAMPLALAGSDTEPAESAGGEWLSEEAMRHYLTGGDSVTREPADALPADVETLIGLQWNAETLQSVSGMLYSLGVHRPRTTPDYSHALLVGIRLPSGASLSDGITFLGGESRTARIRGMGNYAPALAGQTADIATAIHNAGGRFRLYLATPGIFRTGVLPDILQQGEWEGLRFTLRAAASGKPVPVGGWDLAQGGPRDLRRAAPAGTVYYCHLTQNDSETIERLLDAFHFTTTIQSGDSDKEAAYRGAMGFGVTLAGAWDSAETPGGTTD